MRKKKKNIKHKTLIILALGLLSAIGPFSIDMYLPGFHNIATDLGTTTSQIGYSLSSFFIGISIGQLIYGPLIDRFGRMIPLYIGLSVYIATSVLCAFSFNSDMLIITRFFQALGSCAGMVISRALVRDIFPVEENAKIFSTLMLIVAISPMLAPTVGGYLTAHFHWTSIFIALAGIGVLTLLASYFWLPAGNLPNPSISLKPKPIISEFIAVSKVPKFYTYAFSGAISSSGLYAYIAGSPTVFMDLYAVSEKEYGWIFAIISMGMLIASQTNTLLLNKFSSEQITLFASITQVFLGFILVLSTYYVDLSLYSLIGLITAYMATQGYIFPNTSALSLAPFDQSAGSASALMGAVQLGVGAITTAIVGSFKVTSAFPMSVVMLICGVLGLLILYFGAKTIPSLKKNRFN